MKVQFELQQTLRLVAEYRRWQGIDARAGSVGGDEKKGHRPASGRCPVMSGWQDYFMSLYHCISILVSLLIILLIYLYSVTLKLFLYFHQKVY